MGILDALSDDIHDWTTRFTGRDTRQGQGAADAGAAAGAAPDSSDANDAVDQADDTNAQPSGGQAANDTDDTELKWVDASAKPQEAITTTALATAGTTTTTSAPVAAPPARPSTPPVIAVTDKGNNFFAIAGSGFIPNETIMIETAPTSGSTAGGLGSYNTVVGNDGKFTSIIQVSMVAGDKATVTAQAVAGPGVIGTLEISNKVVIAYSAANDPNDPLPDDQKQQAKMDMGPTSKAYEAALQGASGRSSLTPQQIA